METEWLITVTGYLDAFSHSLHPTSSTINNLGGTCLCPLKILFFYHPQSPRNLQRPIELHRAKRRDVSSGGFIRRQNVLSVCNSQQFWRTKVWRDISLKPTIKTKEYWNNSKMLLFVLWYRRKLEPWHCRTGGVNNIDYNANGIPWSMQF